MVLDTRERQSLRRVITLANRKGGVGKTSIATNVAGLVAAADYKVLLVDLDPQGNAGDDLGYRGSELDDEGRALFEALVLDADLVPVRGVRVNLDVLPAGRYTAQLTDSIAGMTSRGQETAELLASKLATVAPRYDVILIDMPPGEAALQTLGFVAARWVILPTNPDDGSLQGLGQIAERILETRRINPTVEPLLAVLFGVVSSGKRIQVDARAKLASILGTAAPVADMSIRFAQAAGVDARSRGQLAFELARDAEEQKKNRFEFLRKRKANEAVGEATGKFLAGSSQSLADDYAALASEILSQLNSQEELIAHSERKARHDRLK